MISEVENFPTSLAVSVYKGRSVQPVDSVFGLKLSGSGPHSAVQDAVQIMGVQLVRGLFQNLPLNTWVNALRIKSKNKNHVRLLTADVTNENH